MKQVPDGAQNLLEWLVNASLARSLAQLQVTRRRRV